mmetsp:Transcript_41310/g.127635  ORF Transcript_41310/g.127635 Transcript_41310/m.127635 type:complete len:282 (+) Transcript_41310:863-1708(+)
MLLGTRVRHAARVEHRRHRHGKVTPHCPREAKRVMVRDRMRRKHRREEHAGDDGVGIERQQLRHQEEVAALTCVDEVDRVGPDRRRPRTWIVHFMRPRLHHNLTTQPGGRRRVDHVKQHWAVQCRVDPHQPDDIDVGVCGHIERAHTPKVQHRVLRKACFEAVEVARPVRLRQLGLPRGAHGDQAVAKRLASAVGDRAPLILVVGPRGDGDGRVGRIAVQQQFPNHFPPRGVEAAAQLPCQAHVHSSSSVAPSPQVAHRHRCQQRSPRNHRYLRCAVRSGC